MGRLEQQQGGEGILGVIFGQIRIEVPIRPPNRGVYSKLKIWIWREIISGNWNLKVRSLWSLYRAMKVDEISWGERIVRKEMVKDDTLRNTIN